METAAPPPPQISYADSLDSSPRSRHTDSWDSPPSSAASAKLRLMCSYGGHIVPRPHDKSLCYVGGTTRIVMVDRNTTLSALSNRLSSSLLDHRSFSLKYQLPNEDLDSLISVSTDEDLDNMIDEYDRLLAASSAAQKPSRLRLFLFPHSKTDSASSIGSLLDDSKTDNWFVDALNGTGVLPCGLSADSSSSNINCLLGLDDAAAGVDSKTPHLPDSTGKIAGQEIHSVPDSPMMETTSSFGSTSSASCLSNLPPIRVRVDDGGGARSQDLRSGLEEHFSHMTVGGVPAGTISPSVENPSRVLSDDERLEQGMPGMVRKPQQNTSQLQQILNVHELPTDAIIGDNSNPSGVISHQKSGYYQEPVVPMPVQERASATATAVSVSDQKKDISDSNYRIPVQVQDPGFILPLQQHEQQQFIHATPHYINPHLTGPVHISSYYQYQMHPQQQQQMHQQQQQQLHQQQQQQQQQQQLHQQQQQQRFDQQQQQRFDQQYPLYFMPVGQNQAYNLAIQPNPSDPPSMPSSKPAFIPAAYKEPSPVHPARSAPPQKPELAANLLYRAAMPAPNQPFQNAAQFIHVSDQQHQYMGYHQLHHPPQSAAAAASPANFAYEFTDPSNSQIYYTQQKSAMLAPQYQTVSSGAMISEISLPPQTAADAKQNRTSQPL